MKNTTVKFSYLVSVLSILALFTWPESSLAQDIPTNTCNLDAVEDFNGLEDTANLKTYFLEQCEITKTQLVFKEVKISKYLSLWYPWIVTNKSNLALEKPENLDKWRRGRSYTIKWSGAKFQTNNLDAFRVIIRSVGALNSVLLDTILTDGGGCFNEDDPPKSLTWTPPCNLDPMIVALSIEVQALERRTSWSGCNCNSSGMDCMQCKCSVRAFVTLLPLMLPPMPDANIACSPGNYEFRVKNNQNADQLNIYTAPDQLTAIETVTTMNDQNEFVFFVPVSNNSATRWIAFEDNSNPCGSGETVRVPVVVIRLNLSSVVQLLEDTALVMPVAGSSCDVRSVGGLTQPCPVGWEGDYYSLSLLTKTADSLLNNLMDELIENFPNPPFKNLNYHTSLNWQDSNYIRNVGTTWGTEQRACYYLLPPAKGSCRPYSLFAEVEISGTLTDKDGKEIGAFDTLRCTQEMKRTQVCKKMEMPPDSLFVFCGEIDSICMPLNGYDNLIWTDGNGDVQMGRCAVRDPQHPNKKFSYTDFIKVEDKDDQKAVPPKYSFTVQYVALNGRESPAFPGLPECISYVELLPLPRANDLSSAQSPFPITYNDSLFKPLVSDTNATNYCSEPKTYFDLDFNADEYIAALRKAIDTLNILDSKKYLSDTTFHLNWRPQQHIYKYGNPPIERVCYYNLPDGYGTCRNYFGSVTFNARVSVNIPRDTLHGTIQCTDDAFIVHLCKATLTSDCSEEMAENFGGLNTDTVCDSSRVRPICAGDTMTLGTSLWESLPLSHTYEWQGGVEEDFITGNKFSQHPEITHASMNIAAGSWRNYRQTVFAPEIGVQYNFCDLVYRCTNGSSCGFSAQNAERPHRWKWADHSYQSQKEKSNDNQVYCFPVPSNRTVNIVVEVGETMPSMLYVQSVSGKEVARHNWRASTDAFELPIQGYIPGLYLVKVLFESGEMKYAWFVKE